MLSVAIVTLNEEQNLARTLASVSFANEIIVVDSGSKDRTLEIAESFGARVIQRAWPGFAAQKNFAMQQCTGDWILSLDADEELSPELCRQLSVLLPTSPPVDAYFLKRRNLFLGRWIKHGGYYPDPKLRLFRRATANFALQPRYGERPVHETIAFDGHAATLDYDLIHHAYPTLEDYLEHMDRYSTLGGAVAGGGRASTSRSLLGFHCQRPLRSPSLPSFGTTSSASASLTVARASSCTSTTPPIPVGSTRRPGARRVPAVRRQAPHAKSRRRLG